MSNSPLTDEESAWSEQDVFEAVWFRVMSTDEEWDSEPGASGWDLSREEAARRLDEKDYSPPN